MDRTRDPVDSRFPRHFGPIAKALAVAAVVVLGGAALLLAPDTAEAGPHDGIPMTGCMARYDVYWAHIEVPVSKRDEWCGGEYQGGDIIDIIEEVPADQPAPAVTCSLEFNSEYPWGIHICRPFYNDDRPVVSTPICVGGGGCNSYSTGLRYRNARVGETTATLRVNNDPDPEVRYQPSANHRAVVDGGQCYREWRDRKGDWRKSASYGNTEEACRRASWNAYLRSEREHLHNPHGGGFPDGDPPGLNAAE